MIAHLLSNCGSDRATAYVNTNRIVRCGDSLFIGWLGAPKEIGKLAPVNLSHYHTPSGTAGEPFCLGHGYNNHCGPALCADGDGRLHAIIGADHHPFLYRWSDTPHLPESWSEPEALGPHDAYPSLIADRNGTLHLTHRTLKMGGYWELWYRRKPKGKPWEAPVVLAITPLPGYSHFYQSISTGPSGTLHLLFQYCYSYSGRSADVRSRMIVHLTSPDGGTRWFNEGRHCTLPLAMEHNIPVLFDMRGGFKITNHLVDAQDRLWFFTSLPEQPTGALLCREESGWRQVDLPARFRRLSFVGGRDGTLSRGNDGTIHLVIPARPDDREADWYDPGFELFHLALCPDGTRTECRQLSATDPNAASWHPALEHWDWARSDFASPALCWTHGVTGLLGGASNINALRTNVFLLPKLGSD